MDTNSVTIYTLKDSLVLTTNNLVNTFADVIPRLLLAIGILLIGILLGSLAKSLTVRLLHAIKLSNLIKGSPVERYSPKNGVGSKIEDLIGEIIRWSIILLFLIGFFNVLSMDSVAQVLIRFVNYIPHILAALIILVIGILVAGLIESFVKNAISTIDPATGRLTGKIASYTVVILAFLAALSELGIAELFVNTLFIGFVAALALGFGLAIGLGAKDVISEVLNEWYHRDSTPPSSV